MGALIGIILIIVVLPYLASRVSQARNAAWTGPRTTGMRGRAVKAPASRSPGKAAAKAAKSAGSMAAHPGSRQIRAQAKADAFVAWQQAFATDHLEQQRHARANGTAPGARGTAPSPQSRQDPAPRWVPPHEAVHRGPVRGPAGKVLTATGAWKLLPGRMQGALCGCEICRSKDVSDEEWERLIRQHFGPEASQPASNGSTPANGNGGPPPRPSPPPAPSSPASSNGGTPVDGTGTSYKNGSFGKAVPGSTGGTPVAAGTSTASAEKAIEGINEIHAHAATGGIHAKREAVKALHEVDIRVAAMKLMLARQMSEPGMNYGPEITEPLAQSAQHSQAAAMSDSESDAALSTLINMNVGELATSPRQAPHNAELSESGAR